MAQWDPRWSDAIASIESSGGNYGLLGPVTKSGDRAYGKYQVMGNNIGPWTQSALGRAMTPQEFLKDQGAQDAVFRQQFGNSVDKYGSPQEAASVWFSGRPMAQAGNASDMLGTAVPGYVGKFNAYLADPKAPPSVQAINDASQGRPMNMPPSGGGTPPPDDYFMGSLLNRINGQSNGSGGQYDLGDALYGAGSSMMALDNARGAAVLAAMQAQNRKQVAPPKQTEWSYEPATGTFYRTNPQTGQLETLQGKAKDSGPNTPKITEQTLKHLDDQTEKYDYLSQSASQAADIINLIDSGKLDLGAIKNMANGAKNFAGMSDDQSRAYAQYNRFIQSLVNDNLRLNKGVQTEGDAYRELKSIAANGTTYDNATAREALMRVINKADQAVNTRGANSIAAHQKVYGDEPLSDYASMTNGWKDNFANIRKSIGAGQPVDDTQAAAPTTPSLPDRSAVEAEMKRRGLLK